jgi:hypothetical protein
MVRQLWMSAQRCALLLQRPGSISRCDLSVTDGLLSPELLEVACLPVGDCSCLTVTSSTAGRLSSAARWRRRSSSSRTSCAVLCSQAGTKRSVARACPLRIVELTLLSTPACISCAKEHIPVRATPETAGSYSQLLVASGRRLFIGTSREGRHKPEFSAAASIETAFNSPHAKAYACQPSVI